MDIELLGRQFAFHEAVALYRMVVQGTDTITEIRELIQVPERVEKALRAYAKAYPDDAQWVERSIKFRSVVLQEFNRLVLKDVALLDVGESDGLADCEFPEPFSGSATGAPQNLIRT